MLRNRILLGVAIASLSLTGCKGDPNTPEYWSKSMESARGSKDRLRLVGELRQSSALNASFLPMLHQQLGAEKNAEVKTNIVRVLNDLKDPSSVQPLLDTIDYGAADSAANAMNKEIASALATIGDKKAIPSLMKLLKSKDNYTKIEAINALGALDATEAVDALLDLATSETGEPFISKKAIIALGNIGDAKAVPSLLRMMFKERRGVSFYMESSFSLFQIGEPAAKALAAAVAGQDKALLEWAKENRIIEPAIFAKSAQVLRDFRTQEAEAALVKQLDYKNGYAEELLVRMWAADALGKMRSKPAAAKLKGMLAEQEAATRGMYIRALVSIGDGSAVPALNKAAQAGSWDAREPAIIGVAMLGSGDDLKVLEKLAADEAKIHGAYCKEDPEYDACKDVAAGAKKNVEAIQKHMKRLEAAKECAGDLACWAKKLDDPEAGVRERAAYQLGRGGDAKYIDVLVKRLSDENLETRAAAITAADWLITDSPEAFKTAKGSLEAIQKQLQAESGKTTYVKVNEDLRRLAVKMARGA